MHIQRQGETFVNSLFNVCQYTWLSARGIQCVSARPRMYSIASRPLLCLGCMPFLLSPLMVMGKAMSDLVSTSCPFPKKWRSGNAGVLITLLGLAAVLAINLLSIKTGVYDAMSTDDAMRFVEVRDLINGQGWFDLWQYRLNPPGVLMHWSRVIDLPLTVSILLLKPLIGVHDAESVTLFLWPLLLFAVALALVVAIARQMSDGAVTSQIGAAVLAMLAKPALIHFQPGAI